MILDVCRHERRGPGFEAAPALLRSIIVAAFTFALVCPGASGRTLSDGKFELGIAPDPDWSDPLPLGETQPAAEAGVRYLLVDQQVMQDSEGTLYRYHRMVTEPVTAEGVDSQSVQRLRFLAAWQQLTVHHVLVTRDGHTRDRLNDLDVRFVQEESESDALIYTGSVAAHLILKDVRRHDRIDIAYTVSGSNPVFGGRFYAERNIGWYPQVGVARLRFLVPRNKRLYVRTFNTDASLTRSRSAGRNLWEWVQSPVPGLHPNEGYPEWDDPYPRVEASEFSSWKALAREHAQEYAQEAVGTRFDELFSELDAEHDDDTAFIIGALRWVQENIRYVSISVGINAWRPQAPETVLVRGYGDCKDKSLLFESLLHRRGIRAWPALVSTIDRGHVDRRLPSPLPFDHVITAVEQGGRLYWFDATATEQRGTLDTIALSDFGQGLLLRKRSPGLVPIEWRAEQRNFLSVDTTYDFTDLEAPTQVSIQSLYRGLRADDMRRLLSGTDLASVAERFSEYRASYLGHIVPLEPPRWRDDVEANEITLWETYRASDFWQAVGPFRSAELFHRAAWERLDLPETTIRKDAYALGTPAEIHDSLTVRYPEAIVLSIDDEPVMVEAGPIRFHGKSESAPGRYSMDASLTVNRDYVRAEEAPAYRDAVKRIREQTNYTLTIGIPGSLTRERDRQALLERLDRLVEP